MSTGAFENWAGNIADIGPIYPFVGSEWLWFVIGVAVWIVWQIWQIRHENRTYAEELTTVGTKAALSRIVSAETVENP
jgi:hypothetical protein